MNRSALIFSGLVSVFLIVVFSYNWNRPNIEDDIGSRAKEAMTNSGISWIDVEADEGTLRLMGIAPSVEEEERAVHVAESIIGVATIDSQITLNESPNNRSKGRESSLVLSAKAQECQDLFDEAISERSIEFRKAGSEILASSQSLLDDLRVITKKCPNVHIDVEGHTDSDGSAAKNLQLSRKRAEAVLESLLEKGGDKERLRALGYGEMRPIADNATSKGKAINRRIEFKVKGS